MDVDLKAFVVQWLRVVVVTLIPVVFAAFIGMPLALGGHPSEDLVRAELADLHMT